MSEMSAPERGVRAAAKNEMSRHVAEETTCREARNDNGIVSLCGGCGFIIGAWRGKRRLLAACALNSRWQVLCARPARPAAAMAIGGDARIG